MNFLYDTFKPFCARNGIHLLADDMRYLSNLLQKVSPDRRKRVMKQYYEEWLLGMGEAHYAGQRMNFGRKRANLFLGDICG